MTQFIKYLRSIHSSKTPDSSKRFYGGVGFVCVIVFVGLFRHDLVGELMITCAGLLGLGGVLEILKK